MTSYIRPAAPRSAPVEGESAGTTTDANAPKPTVTVKSEGTKDAGVASAPDLSASGVDLPPQSTCVRGRAFCDALAVPAGRRIGVAVGVGPAVVAKEAPQAERELQAEIDRLTACIGAPENQIPIPVIGQGIVKIDHGRRVEYTVAAVDGEHGAVTLRHLDGGEVKVTMGKLAEMLLDESQHLELRAEAATDAPRVRAPAELMFERLVTCQQALGVAQTRRELGETRFAMLARLLERRGEVVREASEATRDLHAWREEHGGISSMSRLATAAVGSSSWEEFKRRARNAEEHGAAPQRAGLERLERALGALDEAIALVRSGKSPASVDVSADPSLRAIVELEGAGGTVPSLETELTDRMAFLRRCAEQGSVADGWMAYHGVVQPYLRQSAAGAGSFHVTGEGQPSLTQAVNVLIQKGELGDRRLVLASADLKALAPAIAEAWPRVQAELDKQRGRAVLATKGWAPKFDPSELSSEVERLQRVEADPAVQRLSQVVDRGALDGAVKQIIEHEPGFFTRFGRGTLAVLDSPQTWAIIAAGAVTGPVAGLALGEAAVGVTELAVLYRAGTITPRALRLFGAGVVVDGTLVHASMNLFNTGIGESRHVDWTPGGFARSVAMMGVSQGLQVGRAVAAARTAPGLLRAAGLPVVHFAAETAGLSMVSLAERYIAEGRIDDAWRVLEENAQYMLAVRTLNATRERATGTHGDKTELDRQATAFQAAERAYLRDPSRENIVAAFEAQRAYAATLERINGRLYARGLASQQMPMLRARTRYVSFNELRGITASVRQEALGRAKTPEQKAAVRTQFDALERDPVAVFDPRTGLTFVHQAALERPDAMSRLRNQWTRQQVYSLPADARGAVVDACLAHPRWLELRDAVLRDEPRAAPHDRAAQVREVEEVLARAHSPELEAPTQALVKALMAQKPLQEAGLWVPPVPELIEPFAAGYSSRPGAKPEVTWGPELTPLEVEFPPGDPVVKATIKEDAFYLREKVSPGVRAPFDQWFFFANRGDDGEVSISVALSHRDAAGGTQTRATRLYARDCYYRMFRHFEARGQPIKAWSGTFRYDNYDAVQLAMAKGATKEQAVLQSVTARFWKEWAERKGLDMKVTHAEDNGGEFAFRVEFVAR